MAPQRGRGGGRGGRGRGASRGRGGSTGRGAAAAAGGARGRGGRARGASRGRGRGRGGRRSNANRRSSDTDQNMVAVQNFDATKLGEYEKLFLDASYQFDQHLAAQNQDKWHYLATLYTLRKSGVDVLAVSKVRALAVAWARHDHELVNFLLKDESEFGVVEVLKATTMLDAGRRARAQERRAARLKLNMQTAGKNGKSRLGKKLVEIKKLVHNYNRDKTSVGSVSGALSRTIGKWTNTIPKERLEFFALHLPKNTWTQLADIVHLHPEKNFKQCPWFLKYCFNEADAPAGSLAAQCAGLTEENVNEYVAKFDVPFAHIKNMAGKLTIESKVRIAKYTTDVDTLLWEYEDLGCAEVDSVISERLNAGEAVNMPYGKLMERLLMLRKIKERAGEGTELAPFYPKILPYAEKMLKTISLTIDSPVVVIGDASASMDVAIQTSTIIASFLTALTNADLVFFSDKDIKPKFIPQTVEQVLDLAMVTKTVGCTANATGLAPYYMQKKVVKTFIMCTDEEENTNWTHPETKQSYRFKELFELYSAEVYPARLIFVSFLRSQHARGQMFAPMLEAGLPVTQFKLDGNRPDLQKLNNLVGQLSLGKTGDFTSSVSELSQELRQHGLETAFEKLAAKISK